MPLATWRKSMDLDYPPLDEEHKAFLEVINQAYFAAQVDDFQMIEKVFEKCYEYVQTHFSHEEDILERIQFPDTENHINSHQIFIKNISQMRQEFEASKSKSERHIIAQRLADFLNAWWLGHIMGRDRLFKPYLVRLRNLPPRMKFGA